MPLRGPAEPSTAFTDTQASTLGRIAANSTPAGRSSFGLLPSGGPAFGARSALAARAERSLDIQYYHLHADSAGAEFLRELREAAGRGVRVRLLVDDLHAIPTYPLLTGLAAHPGVQVRLFNPFPTREGDVATRLRESFGSFDRLNCRMHNKLFVADNAVAIFGGRNIADEYFMRHSQANFVDLDVIAAGPVVQELSDAFDRYWNSEHAYPLHAVIPDRGDPAQARSAFEQAVGALSRGRRGPAASEGPGPPSVAAQLAAGRLLLHTGVASVHVDPPSKVGTAWSRMASVPWSPAFRGVTDMIASARSDVIVVTPYFVLGAPGRRGLDFVQSLTARGLRLRLYTNSLGSTDEPLVHAAYASYRAWLLRQGLEIYELKPEPGDGSGRLGTFGESLARLHAKVAIVDGQRLAVGSVNMDARSAMFNTELTVVLDCEALAQEATRLILGYESNMYRLRLAGDGSTIEWLMRGTDGRITSTTQEPHIGRRQGVYVDHNFL